MTSVIVHFEELALKGQGRPWFIGALLRNIRTLLADLAVRHVASLVGRIEFARAAEALLEIEALVAQALRETVVEERMFPAGSGLRTVVENDKVRRLLA